MIDIEKFICSLLADHPEGITVRNDIHKALKEQGLEYKDGKIVPIEDKNELKEKEKPNGGIVSEDFNEGDGFYKVNLAYLSKEQVDEIESIVKKWNHTFSKDEKIRKEIIKYLRAQKKFLHHPIDDEWVAWLEKQGQTFTKKDVDDAYLKGMCDAKHELEKQGEQKPIERKDFISVPFGAFDSELVNETITIPDGCVATIEGNKIHIKREDL